jgi:hypothetical protein
MKRNITDLARGLKCGGRADIGEVGSMTTFVGFESAEFAERNDDSSAVIATAPNPTPDLSRKSRRQLGTTYRFMTSVLYH